MKMDIEAKYRDQKSDFIMEIKGIKHTEMLQPSLVT